MTTMNSVSDAVGNTCGNCKHRNGNGELFCAGCGQTLVEPCATCSKQVSLTQKFCGSCGTDLAALLNQRIAKHGESMAEAVQAAKAFDFDRSISLLGRVAELNDYRFAKEASDARKAIEKIEQLKLKTNNQFDQHTRQAAAAFDRGDHAMVVKMLGEVPPQLLSPDDQKFLSRSKNHLGQIADIDAELRQAVSAKQWVVAGGLLDQLNELAPSHPTYTKLAGDLSQKLLANANAQLAKSKYTAALQCVSAIPAICQNEESERLRGRIDNVHWLADQFPNEPYALPLLGRLCVRFNQESPDDETAKVTLKRLSEAVRSRASEPRLAYADWDGGRRSWMGGQAGILAYPQSLSFGDTSFDRNALARHSVAFGLALQGLGIARVEGDFSPPKKGLMSAIRSRKKIKSCWGIDVGSSGIRGAHLELTPEGAVQVVAIYTAEFLEPACRVGSQTKSSVIRDAILTMADEIVPGETPIWISMPTTETVNRFVRLPPVDKKQANKLLDVEINQRIPLPLDELGIVRWMADEVVEETKGRPAFVSAARQTAIESRIDLFQSAGLTVSGLQSAAIALVNFSVYEFATHWKVDPESETTESEHSEAFAIVDSGAETLTVALIARDEFWFSSIENAGENFTSLLARSIKRTNRDAEQLKRDPAKIESPSSAWTPLENRMGEIRARLEQTMTEANKFMSELDVIGVWCVGGSAFTFGWIRRVLLKE
ncbi:pilus assembly protein PilM [Rubripirellula reticaptiva]|uniref:Competence protein A n=1 Tax=Rubripirellula reticaptiva TaxID=2528013 RepID=A0A5C6FER7_9BACT|nr:pilus assembly protein PilM [Rubripirellula reticaptiva]TWU58081.1 Competence protein A [Rubripirellula reticaptiva]